MRSSSFRILIASFFVIGLLSMGIRVYAVNVNPAAHPNLAAAQEFVEKASIRYPRHRGKISLT